MLEIRQLRKRFANRLAADDLSLTVARGEILALLGPSGCGKSTLLKMIAGLLPADAGTIALEGRDMAGVPPEARHMALMFQDFALFPHLDVLGNVMFGLLMRGMPKAAAREAALLALERVDLAGFAARSVLRLSGGEQQRVALARALVTRPALMLLDEPFSSLDAHLRGQLGERFRRMLKEAGITTILVTHDREEAFALADRIALLRNGRVVQCAAPADLLAAPCDADAARFIGYDNVTESAVWPPAAFVFGADEAAVPVASHQVLAEGVQVVVVLDGVPCRINLSAREAGRWLSPDRSLLRVGIDPQQVIRFAGVSTD